MFLGYATTLFFSLNRHRRERIDVIRQAARKLFRVANPVHVELPGAQKGFFVSVAVLRA